MAKKLRIAVWGTGNVSSIKKRIVIVILSIVVFALFSIAITPTATKIHLGIYPFEGTKIISTSSGEVIDHDTSFVKYGEINSGKTEKKGTFHRVEYTTDAYEDGVVYEKYCNVYLPYGYDASDTDKKYNVVYFQHGHTGDPDVFLDKHVNYYFDNLFASGEVDPVIIVFTTYYMDPEGDAAERKKSGNVPAGDGMWADLPGNFYLEVVEDIIPAVESRYNTYTESFDAEGLKASRDHRAFTGYSRGAVCTWYMFHHSLEYFRWFSPMSCHCFAETDNATDDQVLTYLKEAIDAHPDLDFFIYASSGCEKDAPAMRTQMRYLLSHEEVFLFGTDTETCNIYYAISDFRHSDWTVPYSYYNSLPLFFQ